MAKVAKSSMTPKIIIGIIILLIIGAGAYLLLGNGKNSVVGSAVNKITSAKDMLSASVSMHCEYTEAGRTSKVEIKNGAMRVDATGATPEENGSIILKNKKMYMWNGKQGYVYDVPDDQTTGGKAGDKSVSQKEDLMKSLEAYKDACKPAVVSDSLFDAPSDVTFTDMANLLKQNSTEMQKYQQQYVPPATQGDYTPPSDQ